MAGRIGAESDNLPVPLFAPINCRAIKAALAITNVMALVSEKLFAASSITAVQNVGGF